MVRVTRFVRFLALAAAFCLPARADNTATDYSDLWWNPAHPGWGLGIDRQGDTMFATLFVYGADGTATWLTASDVHPSNASSTSWTGKLYRTSGLGFASAFDASTVTIAEVGALRIDFSAPVRGTLTYSVDGATIVEPIERLTFRAPSIAGSYRGGMSALVSACTDEWNNGALDMFGSLSATQSGAAVTIAFTSEEVTGYPSSCSFTGNLSQAGRLGSVAGNWRCTIVIGLDDRNENIRTLQRVGTFTIDRLAATSNGFAGRLAAKDQDCTVEGHLGGVRLP
jgi:hypothetical protein